MDDPRWDRLPDPPMYFDREGQPITLRRYCELREDASYFRVAESQVGDYWVSTVWLGIDYSFMPWVAGHQPIVFETMVFSEGGEDRECVRWATEAEAMKGHLDMVALVAATT